MAYRAESQAVTRVYRARLNELRRVAERQTLLAWNAVDPTDVNGTLPPVLAQVDVLLSVLQAEAARSAGLYLEAFVASETGEPFSVPVDGTRYAGRTRDGRATADVLALARVSMLTASGVGASLAGVSTAGLARTLRAVRTETVDAARTAQGDAMDASDRISGFYRAASGDPCGACLGEAGRKFKTGVVFAIHGACRCTAEPIVQGVPDRFPAQDGAALFAAMDPADQDRLYGAAAEGLRDGTLAPQAMVTTREAHAWGSMLFQTPMANLSP